MPSILRRPDGSSEPSGNSPTKVSSFRVFTKDLDALAQEPYKQNNSFLVRMLLDMYFKDQLPAAKAKFLAKLAEYKTKAKQM